MNSNARNQEIVDRFDIALNAITDGGDGRLPENTLLRTAVWWVALGLVIHDLHRSYGGGEISEEAREVYLKRLAAIDWSLGNPEFSFLGEAVADKDRKTGTLKPIPTDGEGRPIITRFHGGSKAYFNLAAFIRRKIGLYSKVGYGLDYGVSVHFDPDGRPIDASSEVAAAQVADAGTV